jgi:hypothetical protein
MTADKTRKTATKKQSPSKASAPRAESKPRRSAVEVARTASDELARLVGKPVEGVTGVDRNEDDEWTVRIEVLELRRIPETTDVLGLYEVQADEKGALTSYRRIARYTRADARQEE